MQNVNFSDVKVDFEQILKSVPGYVYWKDKNLVYLGCNQNVAMLLGFKNTSDIVGKMERDFPWGHIPELVSKSLKDDEYILNTGKTVLTEDRLWIKNSQGLEIVLRTEKTPLFDKNKNIIGILGVGMDVTLQKYEEQQKLEHAIAQEKYLSEKIISERENLFSLLESVVSEVTGQTFFHRLTAEEYIDEMRDFLQKIILQMPGYVYLKDRNFKYVFCNQNILDFFGFSSLQDIVKKTRLRIWLG